MMQQPQYEKGKLYELSIIDLKTDPYQPEDGNRQLSGRPTVGRIDVKESGMIRPQNFLMVV